MAIMRRGGVHRRRDEKGASAVEFALVLPVLLALLLGIIEFGFAFNNQISLQQAVREGVRVEALGTGDWESTTETAFLGARSDDSTLDVTLPSDCDDDNGDDSARVRATYDYEFFSLPVDGPRLSAEAEMRCGG